MLWPPCSRQWIVKAGWRSGLCETASTERKRLAKDTYERGGLARRIPSACKRGCALRPLFLPSCRPIKT
jgi:hypothetical protein